MNKEKLKGLEDLNEIAFTESEKERMIADFEFMASEEELLKNCGTDDVEPMVFVLPLVNVLREDKRIQEFSRESLLNGAPEHTEDSWQVPRLVK